MLLRRMLNFRTIEKHQSRASETIWDLTIRRPAQWFQEVYKTGANPFVIVYTREWPGDSWEGLRFRYIPSWNLMIAAFWDKLICIPLLCAIRFENAVIFDISTPTYGFNNHMRGPVQSPGLQWLNIWWSLGPAFPALTFLSSQVKFQRSPAVYFYRVISLMICPSHMEVFYF